MKHKLLLSKVNKNSTLLAETRSFHTQTWIGELTAEESTVRHSVSGSRDLNPENLRGG